LARRCGPAASDHPGRADARAQEDGGRALL